MVVWRAMTASWYGNTFFITEDFNNPFLWIRDIVSFDKSMYDYLEKKFSYSKQKIVPYLHQWQSFAGIFWSVIAEMYLWFAWYFFHF